MQKKEEEKSPKGKPSGVKCYENLKNAKPEYDADGIQINQTIASGPVRLVLEDVEPEAQKK